MNYEKKSKKYSQMVNQLFEFIGLKMKIANPWIDTFAVNCVELPFGDKLKPSKRIVNLEGSEKIDYGISDINGTGFYIKIDPKFTYTPQRQLSSSIQEFEVAIKFRFVFFQINCDIERKKITLENIFSNNFRKMGFGEYLGGERKIKLSITQTNTDAIGIFKEEIGKDLSFGSDCLFIAVDGRLTFLSTDENCESECGVSTTENILQSFDFCKPEIFAQLSEAQKICLADQFCIAISECETKFKKLSFTGDIDGVNLIFVAEARIEQVFKNSSAIFETSDYTLSADGKTITLLVVPDPAFDDKLNFFGNK